MATLTKRLAFRMSDKSKGAPRDEDTAIVVFWKIAGGLVAGLALVLLVMNLLGEISFRHQSNDDAFKGVYHEQPIQEQNQNPSTQPVNQNQPATAPTPSK